MTDLLILLGTGVVAGTLAGLLGVGGGIIIVPALILVFEHQGVSIDVLTHVAIGTSLATIVITSLSSIRTHHQHQAIKWDIFKRIAPGIVVGGLVGAAIAKLIAGDILKIIFGSFLLLVALQMILNKTVSPHRQLPNRVGLIMTGTSIGTLSSMLGVGGGTMSVPFLTWCNVAIHHAVATSAAIGLPIAISGVIGYLIAGIGVEHRPMFTIGYINIPAFMSIAIATILFAPVGARLTHKISSRQLRRVFGYFLLLLGVKILY